MPPPANPKPTHVPTTQLAPTTTTATRQQSPLNLLEGDVITMQDIFVFERTGINEKGKVTGRFRATGIRPKASERLAASGIKLPMELFEHVDVVN